MVPLKKPHTHPTHSPPTLKLLQNNRTKKQRNKHHLTQYDKTNDSFYFVTAVLGNKHEVDLKKYSS